MSDEQGTLRAIAHHLASAVAPLDRAFRDEAEFRTLMYRLGWAVQGLPAPYVAAADKSLAAIQALQALADGATLDEVLAVITKVGDVYGALQGLGVAPPGVDAGAFLPEIGGRLFEYLLIEYLVAELPGFYSALEAIGIIAMEDQPPAAGRPGFVRIRIDWDKIPETLADPLSIPLRVYGWGSEDFKFPKVLEIFSELFAALGFFSSIDTISRSLSTAYQTFATAQPVRPIKDRVSVFIFEAPVGTQVAGVGFKVSELPAEGSALEGMIVQPDVPQGIAPNIALGGGWTFTLRAGTDLADQFGIVLRPNEIAVRYPFAPGNALPNAGFGAAIEYAGTEPLRLFGEPDGIRLELQKVAFSADLDLKAGDLEFKAGVAPDQLSLVLTAADLDGFLGSVLGAEEIRVTFPLALSWSNRTGLDFLAGGGFEVSVYPHLDLDLISLDRIDLGMRFVAGSDQPAETDLRAAASFSGALGPIAFSVDRLGAELGIVFQGGNAGPFDLRFGVLWPTGLGMVIDAGIVTGGGFVLLDPDRGRYGGILQIGMCDIGVTAIGILDTKDESGQDLPPPGFSFFMSIAVELPPIQLGYGFTLNGVGGLVGINRRMDSAAILAGVRAGAIDSIMFPEDPIRNANTIISNLTSFFPVAINRYVFGPMAIIGWGTPTLVEVELGIVLEVPAPITLALLGQASVAIPTKELAIISLHLDVVGILDFGRQLFAVDATLRDSYVAAFSLYGDMAMRLSWAASPNFALAVGGLNPHFAPPPGFPTLRRATVALGIGDNPRLSLEGYLAITANSLQFGANAELYVDAAGFNVRGWIGFDSLFIFEPFSFQFDFSAGMTLSSGSTRIAGITIDGHLTGPSPFHAWGEGSISILFVDISVPFDVSFGEPRDVELPDKDPWPQLESAIQTIENWTADLSDDVATATSLRPAAADQRLLLLHPMGKATLRQKVLPFDRPLERFAPKRQIHSA